MKDGTALKIGNELRPAWGTPYPRAIVEDVTTHFVNLRWARQGRGDVVEKHSPLWQLLELVT